MRAPRWSAFSSLLVLAALFCIQGYGQARSNSSGTGGIHVIQGRVYLPNGRGIDSSVRVKLQSTTFSTISVDTDQSGSFIFGQIAPGSYSIVVEAGEAFETAQESVVIEPEIKIEGIPSVVLPKIVNVPVYLQFKKALRAAVQVVNAKMATIPKEAVKHYEAGIKLAQAGKNEEGLAELRQAVTLYSNFSFAYNEMGKIYLALGKYDDAVTAFRSSLELDSQEFEAKFGFGVALLNKKQFFDAQKQLEEAKNMNQTAAGPTYYLGLLFFSMKKFPEARNEFEQTEKLKSDKNYPLTHYYLGGIYWSEKQYKKAADELERYLQIEPSAKSVPARSGSDGSTDPGTADQIRKTIQQLRTKEN